jgi:predicted nucleic acid-binding protein
MIVFLDSGILGLISSPNDRAEVTACQNWVFGLLAKGVYIVSSDICDYEIRRSLLLLETQQLTAISLDRLERWREIIDFLPLTTQVMQVAAKVWAEARRSGLPTAELKNIDADMIIVTQWSLLSDEYPGRRITISTTNVKHLLPFCDAMIWPEISFS